MSTNAAPQGSAPSSGDDTDRLPQPAMGQPGPSHGKRPSHHKFVAQLQSVLADKEKTTFTREEVEDIVAGHEQHASELREHVTHITQQKAEQEEAVRNMKQQLVSSEQQRHRLMKQNLELNRQSQKYFRMKTDLFLVLRMMTVKAFVKQHKMRNTIRSLHGKLLNVVQGLKEKEALAAKALGMQSSGVHQDIETWIQEAMHTQASRPTRDNSVMRRMLEHLSYVDLALDSCISNVQSQRDQWKDVADTSMQRITTLLNQFETSQKECTQCKQQLNTTQRELDKARKQLQQAREEAEDRHTQFQAAERDKQTLVSRIKGLSVQLEEMRMHTVSPRVNTHRRLTQERRIVAPAGTRDMTLGVPPPAAGDAAMRIGADRTLDLGTGGVSPRGPAGPSSPSSSPYTGKVNFSKFVMTDKGASIKMSRVRGRRRKKENGNAGTVKASAVPAGSSSSPAGGADDKDSKEPHIASANSDESSTHPYAKKLRRKKGKTPRKGRTKGRGKGTRSPRKSPRKRGKAQGNAKERGSKHDTSSGGKHGDRRDDEKNSDSALKLPSIHSKGQ